MNQKISVCIIVKNAQATLKECLESLREFDEIILLDNGSTDSTLQIAQDFNATYGKLHIKQSEFIGFGALKNLCVSYAKNEWILSLDSDEVLESSALNEIKAQNLQPQNIYAISRKNLYKGEWIKACGWSPDFVWRIFNKNFTRFNENIVHESVIIPPNAQKIRLQGHIKHYACSGITQLLDKLQRYTSLYVEQNYNKNNPKNISMSKAIARGLWAFVRSYFLRKGIFYGYKGFVISLCNGLGAFFKYAKLYEITHAPPPYATSLIVTTYNQKERLALVLDSLRALNPLPKEVLIADDGSKSDTREVIESYAKDFPCELRHIWHEDKGFRLAQIRNEAIKSAKGEYIIIIDGDMIVDSRFVAEHLRFAKRGVFLQGSRVILNEAETTQILESKNYALAFDSHSLKSTHCDFWARLIYATSKTTAKIFRKKELIKGVRGCNMSFYKADCEAINGFNEEFVGWGREDSEFVARFLFEGGELRRVKFNAIAYHLYHAENPRSALESNHNIYIYIYAKLKQLGQKWVCKRAKSQKSRESRGESSQDSPKKSVLITLKDITEGGGGERVGVNLANALTQNLGYQVQIISFFRTHKTPIYPLDSRISCTYLCDKKAKSKNPLTSLFHKSILRIIFCLKTHKIAQQTNADIILANDGWFVPLFRGVNRGKTRFFIRLWHINAPKRARKKLRLFDALVILSEREMGRWQRYHSNVKVIPNFLPTIPQVSTNHSQKVVLSVGRMSSEKGFLRLLDIWKMVQDSITCHTERSEVSKVRESKINNESMTQERMGESHRFAKSQRIISDSRIAKMDSSLTAFAQNDESMDCFGDKSPRNDGVENDLSEWKLIIVGDGVLKSEIESKIRALNLGESVLLKPFTKDIECEYLNASIYAMASHFEGFPMVLLESTAYGLAPISFDIATGPSDIIEHNKSGFLIADNDLKSYANHLIKLMSDENLRTQFGAESRKIVRENFSKEVVMEKWRDLLEK